MSTSVVAGTATRQLGADFDEILARSYDDLAPAVYGLAQRVTGDDGVAARLTADVFGGIETITQPDALAGCLLTDVHRRAVAWVRRHGGPVGGGIDEACLALLPADERAVITAAYFEGLTYEQAAHRLGVTPSTVVDLMRRGLRRLSTASPEVMPAVPAP